MDLILLEFGDKAVLGGKDTQDENSGWSLIDGIAEGGFKFGIDKGNNIKIDPKKCVELVSINQGIQQQVTTDVSNGSRTSGRPIISDFTCVKYVDAASPKLYDYCLRAMTLDKVAAEPTRIHVLRNSGDRMGVLMTFELRLALISEIQFQSHPNDMATEQFKLNFTEISWIHSIQGAGITNPGQVSAGWSIARNRPIAPSAFSI
jgi:type VI secretion system secreted protein Hcp